MPPQHDQQRLFVLTGAPGSGKSSIIKHLSKRGFDILPESYRWLRLFMLVEGIDKLPPRSTTGVFPSSLFDMHLVFERFREDAGSPNDNVTFMDRSMIDLYAYASVYCPSFCIHLEPHAKRTAQRLSAAFLITRNTVSPTPDWLRNDTADEAARINHAICEAYDSVFKVPLTRVTNSDIQVTANEIITHCLDPNISARSHEDTAH